MSKTTNLKDGKDGDGNDNDNIEKPSITNHKEKWYKISLYSHIPHPSKRGL